MRRPGEKRGEEPVELVLVDGEDLSAYRRASGAVKWVVDGAVGAGEGGRKRKREVSRACAANCVQERGPRTGLEVRRKRRRERRHGGFRSRGMTGV